MTFKAGDRVKLREGFGFFEFYGPDDICTVVSLHNSRIGILSDRDPDTKMCLWVSPDDIAHVTKDPPSTSATAGAVRTFTSGATRDLDENKLDFEGFLSPLVLKRYAEHMHAARKLPDGSMRESDNWQKGIPLDVYMKSMWRHFVAVWTSHRGLGDETDIEAELCALRFNVDGMLHEVLKAKRADAL